MKAHRKTVSVQETGLDTWDGKNMIFKIIDNQINNYKLQFLTDWERNHDVSPVEKEQKIEKLMLAKENLQELFKNIAKKGAEVNFTLNLDVEITSKEHATMRAHSIAV